jgi:hypothetical protein
MNKRRPPDATIRSIHPARDRKTGRDTQGCRVQPRRPLPSKSIACSAPIPQHPSLSKSFNLSDRRSRVNSGCGRKTPCRAPWQGASNADDRPRQDHPQPEPAARDVPRGTHRAPGRIDQARGLIQPITLKPLGGDRYMIVAGECRFRAHQLLGARLSRPNRRDRRPRNATAGDRREPAAAGHEPDRGGPRVSVVDSIRATRRRRSSTSSGSTRPPSWCSACRCCNLTPDIQRSSSCGQLAVTMAWGVAHSFRQRTQTQLVRATSRRQIAHGRASEARRIALRDAEQQIDAFADLPKASTGDLATISRLEAKIEPIARWFHLASRTANASRRSASRPIAC